MVITSHHHNITTSQHVERKFNFEEKNILEKTKYCPNTRDSYPTCKLNKEREREKEKEREGGGIWKEGMKQNKLFKRER